MLNMIGNQPEEDPKAAAEKRRLLNFIQSQTLAHNQGRPQSGAEQLEAQRNPEQSLREVLPRGDGQGFQLGGITPQAGAVDGAEEIVLAPNMDEKLDRAKNLLDRMNPGTLAVNSAKASAELPKKAGLGDKEKTPFDELDIDAKFSMQQLLAAVPLLRNMDDAQFHQSAPQLVLELKKINPFLAKMIPQGGLTKESLEDIVEGMGGLNSSSRKRGSQSTPFQMKDVSLPDGTKVIGRLNPSTGEVFVRNKGGEFVPAPFGTNFKGDDGKVSGAEDSMRAEYTKGSGEFIKVRDAFNRVSAAASEPSAAGDLAMVFNFMKMLDPGSTVREGEFATAANAAGVPQRIIAKYNKALNGEILTVPQRKDFMNQANNLFGAAEKQNNKLKNQLSKVAKRRGLNVDNIFTDIGQAKDGEDSNDPKENIRKLANGQEVPFNATPEDIQELKLTFQEDTVTRVFPLEFKKAVKEMEAGKGSALDDSELDFLQQRVMDDLLDEEGFEENE